MHGYGGNIGGTGSIKTFTDNLKNNYPGIRVLFTEITEGLNSANFNGDLQWAIQNIIMPCAAVGAEAILYFNFALGPGGMPFIA